MEEEFCRAELRACIFFARVDGESGVLKDEAREFIVPAVDLRIFRGVNVSKRGGFYTGIETGVLIFAAPGEVNMFYDEPYYWPDVGFYTTGLDFGAKMEGGLVFLMAKYGLRMDVGIALIGASFGLEAGAEASLFSGCYRFFTGGPKDTTVDVSSGSSAAIMGLIVDINAEGALRFGKNFRLFAKAGIMIAPIDLPDNRWDEYEYIASADGLEPWVGDNDRHRYLLSKYGMDLDPFGLGARVGFSLNFN